MKEFGGNGGTISSRQPNLSMTMVNKDMENCDEYPVSISVITATYNAVTYLPTLIESLRSQTDKDFEWIVADGGSTDGTLELLESIDDLRVVVSSRSDFGIYDALNRAINLSKATHYIVIGADDFFYPDALENFRINSTNSSRASFDMVCAGCKVGGKVRMPMKGKGWLYGMSGEASSHSVALMIRKQLHDIYGMYSRSFPICADQLFVRQALCSGATLKRANFVAGEYGQGGFSAKDVAGRLSEFFRVQLQVGEVKSVQFFLYVLRLIKNYRKL